MAPDPQAHGNFLIAPEGPGGERTVSYGADLLVHDTPHDDQHDQKQPVHDDFWAVHDKMVLTCPQNADY